MGKKVILIGLHPDVVEWDKWPDLSPEKLIEGTKATKKALEAEGFDLTIGFIKTGDEGAAEAEEMLIENSYDVVLIGAGVRKDDDQFILFEKLLNLIHEHAPSARIAFNSTPSDTIEAVKRWI